MINQGCFAQVQVAVGKWVFPFEQQLPGLFCSASDHSSGSWRFNSSRIHPFWGPWVDSPRFPLGGPPMAPGWLEGTLPTIASVGSTIGMGNWVPHANWHLGGTWVQLTICGSQYHVGGQLGTLWWINKHMDPLTVSLDACAAMYASSPEQGNIDPPCGMDVCLNIIQAKFPGCCRVGALGGGDFLPCFQFTGWSDPDTTALKWGLFPGHGCPHKFSFCHHSHHPIYNFASDHDWDLLGVGCGQYDQQQNLLKPFIPRICRLTSTYPRYGMAEPPIPSSSINLPRGWTFRAMCSQNPEIMLETCVPGSVNSHLLPIYSYRGLIGLSYQAGSWVWIQKRNNWSGLL